MPASCTGISCSGSIQLPCQLHLLHTCCWTRPAAGWWLAAPPALRSAALLRPTSHIIIS